MDKWLTKWGTAKHLSLKKQIFHTIDNYIDFKPKRILDIGCGLAYESELFQKKYGSELYLLDGDYNSQNNITRDVDYGTVEDFRFYNTIDELTNSYDSRGMKYTFVDANNIDIPDDITFDLVLSNLSCGFHYPANTYQDLVLKHTLPESKIIIDIRSNHEQSEFSIVSQVCAYKKHIKAEIKYNHKE